MFGSSEGGDGRPSLLAGTIKTVVVVGALSYLAAGWLSSASQDHQTLTRLAASASQGVPDPLTTGSIAGRANATRIDPCALPQRRP